jgi:hypothetical protein
MSTTITQAPAPASTSATDQLCIITSRTLSMDAVQQKKFGFTPDAVAAAAKEELAKAQ